VASGGQSLGLRAQLLAATALLLERSLLNWRIKE
jgi:hypothetical protein